MKKWGYIKISSGVCINVVESEFKPTEVQNNNYDWVEIDPSNGGFGHSYDFKTKVWTKIPEEKPPTILSRLKLIEEFKTSYANILTAAKTDVNVEVWLEKFRLQDSFLLSDENVKEQINFLVTKKLLSRTEADRILSL